jgi:hypothetical protein
MSHIIVSLILQLTQNFVFYKIPSKTVLSDYWLVAYLFRFKHGICIMFCTISVTGQVFRNFNALFLLSDIFFYKYHYAIFYLRLAGSHATVYLSLFSRSSLLETTGIRLPTWYLSLYVGCSIESCSCVRCASTANVVYTYTN